ncbi:MAG: TetR/AcrR family transcriptional regulator [Dysgonamonadaceae bacterium]|nr:TetR/AcrR family transcriptional regulator [Dysgonamonadaceae bacterium]
MDLKERIVQEASVLFFKNGIRSVTMSDIANQMGISKRTLYEVFEDKEDLLEESIDVQIKTADKEIDRIINSSENVIDTMMRIYAKHLNDANEVNKSVINDLKKYHPRLYKQIEERQGERITSLIPLFQRGVEQGLIRDDINFEICIWLIKSQFRTLMTGNYIPTDKFSINQFVRTIILNFARGIATIKGNEVIDEMIRKLSNSEIINNQINR